MPSLLCGSPCLLDNSFPRTVHDLQRAVQSIGQLQLLIDQNKAHLVFTEALALFALDFDWDERGEEYPLLTEIYRLLSAWINNPTERVVRVQCDDNGNASPHPLPDGVAPNGWAKTWSEELGALLVRHDASSPTGFFIGIACEQAFSGETLGSWRPTQPPTRVFPLVGPEELDSLDDAYEWEDTPSDIGRRPVSLSSALENVAVLGATRIDQPQRDSHYKVHFPDTRPWTLSVNVDPVPADFIGELVDMLGFPLRVVRTALLEGRMPQRTKLRIAQEN